MNQAVDFINQSQVDTKLLALLEICELEMVDELEILFFFLLVLGVSSCEEGDAEEKVEEVATFGHVLLDVFAALI